MKSKTFSILVVLNLVLLNAFMGFSILKNIVESPQAEYDRDKSEILSDLPINNQISCSPNCLEYIDEKIASIIPSEEVKVIEREVIVTQTPQQIVVTNVSTPKIKSASYVPIPGSGNTLQTIWTDIEGTDFYLSKADYPGYTEAYFEANTKLLNGNGKGFLRIYDVTNGRAVDGSEIETDSQKSEFVGSGRISLWEGYNQYRVQAKSLTADTTYFESGRLKIITEN